MADGFTGAAHGRLKSFVERIERLEEDKKAVTTDLSEVFQEAKGEGFDVKILRKVIKLRGQDPARRQEEEALVDLYMSALGEPSRPDGPRQPPPTPLEEAISKEPPGPPAPPPAPPPVDTIEEARAKGTQAAKNRQPITTNPYLAGTAQRTAWDEAWCKESGSDGMDIPDAWKPAHGKKGGKK